MSQFRNIFPLLLTVLALLSTAPAQAQVITTNKNGEKIILYPDGSWRYFDARLGSEIENEKMAAESEKEREEQIKKYREELIQATERAYAEEKAAQRNYESAQFDRVLIEEELEEVSKTGKASKAEINAIKLRLKEAEELERKSREDLHYAQTASENVEEKSKLSDDEIYQLIVNNSGDSARQTTTSPTPQAGLPPRTEDKKVFATFSPKDDVMRYPPPRKCNLTFDDIDEFSGKKRREVAKEGLFSHTAEEMRPFFKDRHYITCQAYLSSLSGGYTYLSLEIKIANENAQRDYGMIEKGSILNIKLLNNDNIKLFNNKTDVGVINELDRSVTYFAQYIISSGNEKSLRKSEIDKIRMIWSSGYEDYEVHNVDFFTNQLNCLYE